MLVHRFVFVGIASVVLGLSALAGFARAEDNLWQTDFEAAKAKAKAEKKLLLVDFTGSDWCGWCIKLNKEVFSQPAFAEYAKKSLVAVEVDFPNKKKLSAEQKQANDALAKKYGIRGYPTIIVLNSEGKKVGELGYQPVGPKPFIASLEKLK
jgi:protein disulfide-isomerase